MKQIVKDHPNLLRDPHSKGILNVDNKGLQEYRLKKSQNNLIMKCQDDINTLKHEIKDIKDMFGQILNKLDSKEK